MQTGPMHQLDIFADSRDRVLINRLADALCDADIQQAQSASAELAQDFPTDRHLPCAALLIETLASEKQLESTPLQGAAQAESARDQLLQNVAPAALQVLGADAAQVWLLQRWQALAQRAAALPFDPLTPEIHATALWLQGGAWAQAELAAMAIESWRRKPAPLAWVAQARWHLQGPDAAWPLLAEVAWLAPQRLPILLAQLPDKSAQKWAKRFEDTALADSSSEHSSEHSSDHSSDKGSDQSSDQSSDHGSSNRNNTPDWRWWPAWLLVEQPLLAAPLQVAMTDGVPAPQAGFRLVLALLRAERQGRHADLVALRKQLQALKPALFLAYMATR